MSANLIPLKFSLSKYYTELLYSASLNKYKKSGLDEIFEQRFHVQNNKIQMIVDPGLSGLVVTIAGNEVHISKALYDHVNVVVTNTLENGQLSTAESLYNPEIIPTMAYLMCQNHTIFQIVGDIEEPIYVKYKTDFETFYSSVVIFNISDEVDVEIVEEVESVSALNSITNYILYPSSRLNLTTFYQNNMSGFSMCYRNVIAQENSKFNHFLFGKGSYKIVDETKIKADSGSEIEMMGIVKADNNDFHSILYVEPESTDYHINVNYRNITTDTADVTFFPVIFGSVPPESASINMSRISLDKLPPNQSEQKVKNYISDLIGLAVTERTTGVQRFYSNKKKFLQFP